MNNNSETNTSTVQIPPNNEVENEVPNESASTLVDRGKKSSKSTKKSAGVLKEKNIVSTNPKRATRTRRVV